MEGGRRPTEQMFPDVGWSEGAEDAGGRSPPHLELSTTSGALHHIWSSPQINDERDETEFLESNKT